VIAVVSFALVGCGGSSSSVQGESPIISTTGGIASAGGTSTNPVSSSNSPQQVQVTSGGSIVTGTLPPGESIPAGGSVAVISNSEPIIVGLGLAPKSSGSKAAPSTTGTQGQVYVDGQYSGLTVTSGGALSGYLILTPGTHEVTAYGTFVIVGGTAFATTKLSVGQFNFRVIVTPSAIASVPIALTLHLPINGGSLAHGTLVTAGYDPTFLGYSGTLSIVYGGTTVAKEQTLALNPSTGNATATYNALSPHPQIPAGGVDSVTFNIVAP